MTHTNLRIAIASSGEFIENLGVDHRSTCLQAMLAEKITAIELEGTIHIAHIDPKDHAHQNLPAPGIEFPHPGILTIETVAQHRIILLHQGKETFEVVDIKLPVGVHEKYQVFGRRFK